MNYRHGDMALIRIEKLPEGLIKSDSKVLMTGSGGNDHTYNVGEFYPKVVDNFIFGYFVAYTETKLFHLEHGCKKTSELKEMPFRADVYMLKKQNAYINGQMKPVID